MEEIRKRRERKRGLSPALYCSYYFPTFQTIRADPHSFYLAINLDLDSLEVGFPTPLSLLIGMAHMIAS